MDRVSAGTGKLLQELGPGEEHTLALRQNGKEIQLAVSCSEIRLKNDYFRIVALNNITHQMEEQEIAPPPDLSEFPVSELFGRVRSLFEEDLLVQGIGLHWKLEEAPRIGEGRSIGEDCRIRADRQMMEQVLINLIRNSAAALQGTPEATIELSCEKASPGKTMLVVQDNGDGIPEDKLEQVFVPYFSTRQGGSGIGLSLCRQILRLHRGEIRIQSEEGSGTRVEIQLPSGRL